MNCTPKVCVQLLGCSSSATISLINTRELDELLRVTDQLISNSFFDKESFNRSLVQRLDNYNEQYFFDFFDFLNKAFPIADKSKLVDQLSKTVLYKAHTKMLLGVHEISTYCGLSCYIPYYDREDLNNYYKKLDWYFASGYYNIFK
jgi:hypothetical protein